LRIIVVIESGENSSAETGRKIPARQTITMQEDIGFQGFFIALLFLIQDKVFELIEVPYNIRATVISEDEISVRKCLSVIISCNGEGIRHYDYSRAGGRRTAVDDG
jgi:hypothetical protein